MVYTHVKSFTIVKFAVARVRPRRQGPGRNNLSIILRVDFVYRYSDFSHTTFVPWESWQVFHSFLWCYYVRQGGYVITSVYESVGLFVCQRHYTESYRRMCHGKHGSDRQSTRAHHSSHVHASLLYGIELCCIRCKKLVQEKSCTRNHVRRSSFLHKFLDCVSPALG